MHSIPKARDFIPSQESRLQMLKYTTQMSPRESKKYSLNMRMEHTDPHRQRLKDYRESPIVHELLYYGIQKMEFTDPDDHALLTFDNALQNFIDFYDDLFVALTKEEFTKHRRHESLTMMAPQLCKVILAGRRNVSTHSLDRIWNKFETHLLATAYAKRLSNEEFDIDSLVEPLMWRRWLYGLRVHDLEEHNDSFKGYYHTFTGGKTRPNDMYHYVLVSALAYTHHVVCSLICQEEVQPSHELMEDNNIDRYIDYTLFPETRQVYAAADFQYDLNIIWNAIGKIQPYHTEALIAAITEFQQTWTVKTPHPPSTSPSPLPSTSRPPPSGRASPPLIGQLSIQPTMRSSPPLYHRASKRLLTDENPTDKNDYSKRPRITFS